MSFLQTLIPSNLSEEKEKFFADSNYNPQFVYESEIDKKKLEKYTQTDPECSKIAQNILEKAYFGRSESDLRKLQGPKVSQKTVEKTIKTFLHMHQLQNKYSITWSQSFVARTAINSTTIKLRLPAEFRKQDLIGMLYHEIGTHALRRINYEQQPWFRKKKKYGFENYLETEEGLAILHALIPLDFKSAYSVAIRHVAATAAQSGSFVETWEKITPYIDDLERRWRVVFRQKRGLTDTSKPGGYSKDLVYFEGFVSVYRWLAKNNFDITNLYYGKIALSDVAKAIELNPNFTPKLPSFFTISKEKYAHDLQEIAKFNEIQ